MTYSSIGFLFLILFLILFVISFFLKRFKTLSIILPYKGNFLLLDIFQKFIILFILFLILIIPFNFGIHQGTNIKKIPTLNIEVLFDVSLSMVAKDFDPDRFYVAMNSLINFINSFDTNYNIGVIAFSGKPFVYVPISNNRKAIISKLENTTMADFPPTLDFVGTAIGDAILLGKKQLLEFSKDVKNPGVMILLTDGDTNKGIPSDQALNFAKNKNIPIFVGAIGSDKTYVIGEDNYDSPVDTSMDIPALKKIAEESGGEFQLLSTKEDFLEILSKLYSYVKETEQTERIEVYTYINYYLEIILIICLILYFVFFITFRFNI